MASGGSYRKTVQVTINGKSYTIDGSVPVDTSLNRFIRDYVQLKGTKAMCLEGGCGACIVTLWRKDQSTEKNVPYAVNSCLFPVLACDGLNVTTVEGLGNKHKGYHNLQTRITQLNATQCGFCTPGMIMNMYSLMERMQLTAKEVENSFGGNICRCTGYRPILDAFKSFSTDAAEVQGKMCQDIEDLGKVNVCPKNEWVCGGSCKQSDNPENLPIVNIKSDRGEWISVSTIQDILNIFNRIGDDTYMLVAGNTAQGVYRREYEPKYFINVNEVKELTTYYVEKDLTLGGNMSLTNTMELFESLGKEKPDTFGFIKVLADHIDLVANVPVRNAGTLAGNLSIKHDHHEFPSDIFLILETVGSKLIIGKLYEQLVNLSQALPTNFAAKALWRMATTIASNLCACKTSILSKDNYHNL